MEDKIDIKKDLELMTNTRRHYPILNKYND